MKLRKTLNSPTSSDPSPSDAPPWLKSLPLAPEYRPTLAEFHDPIAYILKIEPEASAFGICKIVPPLPPSPKKLAVSNLNRSLAARHPNPKNPPTFSTRQQQIGLCPRRPRPAQKPVWQSGEQYTLQQFQSKAKQFEQSQLKKTGKKSLSPLETEARFWAAAADKPFTVEYANDVPGSGFAPAAVGAAAGRRWREEEAGSVGETAWNMRRVSRAEGSLLKFMRADIAGVTSPMVYFAMMFSWFAWHAEDHELHSLNYLHFGAGKTWYGVPRDARFAFEEVVRVQGYGGEVNPLVTFSLLGEKTTVMSPEVLVDARIPCCRLVQNAGEFVVTFPGAYHCGFSHGFNCGEAVNIATPEWLRYAKEAAIRRASTNYPPMVSHFQLLYTLALSLSSRLPMSRGTEPRSSRLKDKMKGEGEVMIKKMFVQNVIQNNNLLSALTDTGSSCVVLPKKTSESPITSNPLFRSQSKVTHKLSLGLCSRQEAIKASTLLPSDEIMVSRDTGIMHLNGHCSTKGKVTCDTTEQSSSTPDSKKVEGKRESTPQGNGLLDQGLLSCVTCGILSFACVAVVQPREATRRYLMSANCRFLSEQIGDYNNSGMSWKADEYDLDSGSGQKEMEAPERTYNYLVPCSTNPVNVFDRRVVRGSDTLTQNGMSGLELLASAYGDTSDSEKEELPHEISLCTDENDLDGLRSATAEDSCQLEMGFSDGSHVENSKSTKAGKFENEREMPASISSIKLKDEPVDVSGSELANISHATGVVITHQTNVRAQNASSCSSDHYPRPFCDSERPTGNVDTTQLRNSDKDSSRMHVFCLEHALEVEKQLHPMGGVRIMLLCHPDYPKIEAEAKQLAEELEIEYAWKDINFREATEEDQERIRAALEDEEAIPTNSDWAVKMGINLYYSASLSKSPLYSKQMPYNAIVYKAFGRDSPSNSPVRPKVSRRKPGKRKKIAVTGKWCGKVWMSNQVHPYLAHGDDCKGVENTGRFLDLAIDQKSKVESDSEDAGVETTPKKNPLLEKRKKVVPPTPAKSVAKKPRLEDSSKGAENGADTPSKLCAMVLRARHDKQIDKLKAPDETDGGPSTRLRRRPHKPEASEPKPSVKKPTKSLKEAKKAKDEGPAGGYVCDIEGCSMSFTARHELALHKRDICPVKGCGKKFFAHKYLMQHRKVHMDDRPLECPWKGCEMRFKWPWARTEHLRVHTGDRPYICMEGGCGQTFRFVSDFSRHKRKTGHSTKKERR